MSGGRLGPKPPLLVIQLGAAEVEVGIETVEMLPFPGICNGTESDQVLGVPIMDTYREVLIRCWIVGRLRRRLVG